VCRVVCQSLAIIYYYAGVTGSTLHTLHLFDEKWGLDIDYEKKAPYTTHHPKKPYCPKDNSNSIDTGDTIA